MPPVFLRDGDRWVWIIVGMMIDGVKTLFSEQECNKGSCLTVHHVTQCFWMDVSVIRDVIAYQEEWLEHGVDVSRLLVWFLAEVKSFSVLQRVHTGLDAQSASYSKRNLFSCWSNASGHATVHSCLSPYESDNPIICIFTSTCVVMLRCVTKHRDNLTPAS